MPKIRPPEQLQFSTTDDWPTTTLESSPSKRHDPVFGRHHNSPPLTREYNNFHHQPLSSTERIKNVIKEQLMSHSTSVLATWQHYTVKKEVKIDLLTSVIWRLWCSSHSSISALESQQIKIIWMSKFFWRPTEVPFCQTYLCSVSRNLLKRIIQTFTNKH